MRRDAMTLCMMLRIRDVLKTIILARCALNPAIDGVPAADFHGEVAIVGLELGTSRGPD
jgi:hypothetical protein